jgi:hypothetical protein
VIGIRPKQCGFHLTNREEFEYYIYFWKVIGYCMGIEDRFNICLDDYEQSVAYFDICFKECYKKHLDRQCDVVQMGMKLTEGVFLGIDRYDYQNKNICQNLMFNFLFKNFLYFSGLIRNQWSYA